MKFQDKAEVSGTRTTQDGYLVADAIVARTGIQQYSGAEMGRLDQRVVRVYRSEDQVKDIQSVQTYSHAPITMGHPEEMVTADNWKDLAKGEAGEDAKWEDGRLRLPLIVKDAEAIQAIRDGVRELSAGYTCDIDWTPGTTPDGEAFDAQQTNIRINHVAIVPRGRAGVARIGDAKSWGASPVSSQEANHMADNTQTVVAFDEAYDVNDAGKRLADRYKTALDAAQSENTELADKLSEVTKAKDAEIAKLKAEKDAAEQNAKDAAISPAQMTKLIADRKATIDKAVSLGLDAKKAEEMSEEDMKEEVVKKKMGEKAKDYAPEQFASAFDALEVQPSPHPLSPGVTTKATDEQDLTKAYDEYDKGLSNAWKTPQKETA